MQKCADCFNWVTCRQTVYGDGSVITTFQATEPDKGYCEMLKIDTPAEFGCTAFHAGEHTRSVEREGAPWQNWAMGPCPDCQGRGSQPVEARPACHRCAGTGQVRHYDDGFVGDEQKRQHPKEKEVPETPLSTLAPLPNARSAIL
jgi:hypothetical protein